jgi:hypothetical protein
MGWREDNEPCGPDCVATVCCKTAAQAAASFCGCGGGYHHDDCPPVDDDDAELRKYADAAYRMAVDAFGENEVSEDDDVELATRVDRWKTGAWVTLAVWVANADLGGE